MKAQEGDDGLAGLLVEVLGGGAGVVAVVDGVVGGGDAFVDVGGFDFGEVGGT